MSTENKTVSAVAQLVEPYAKDLGLSVWDIQYVKEGANRFLRIFIDKPDGISIDDCEALSRAIDEPLDGLEILNESYCLEVSSPGIERKLTKKHHFESFIGEPVKVKLIRPNENKERYVYGELKEYNDNDKSFTVQTEDNKEYNYKLKEISFVQLDDFTEVF